MYSDFGYVFRIKITVKIMIFSRYRPITVLLPFQVIVIHGDTPSITVPNRSPTLLQGGWGTVRESGGRSVTMGQNRFYSFSGRCFYMYFFFQIIL